MIIVNGSPDGLKTLSTLINNLRHIDSIRFFEKVEVEKGKFVTPLSLLPLTAYMQHKSIMCDIKDGTGYFKTIRFPYGIDLESTEGYSGTYIPITRVDLKSTPIHVKDVIAKCGDNYLRLLHENIINDPSFLKLVGKNVTGLLVSEMLANVEEHSHSDALFLFSQYFHSNSSCEICLVDLGVGIHGSLNNSGLKGISSSKEALELVIRQQVSSKDSSGRERGYGIKHVRSLLSAREINGFFIIVTGDVAYYCDSYKKLFIDLRGFYWPGTFVCMRFSKPSSKFNYMKYVS